jgi:hypothetical protein
MFRGLNFLCLCLLLFLTACASLPTGPTVMVLPGTGRSFEQFRADDVSCQQFALFQVGGDSPNDAAVSSGLASAGVGTVIGAAAGAALTGNAAGAAIGAGTGLVGGSLAGTSAANSSRYASQQHYDVAYIQCMYAKGHQVPVAGQFSNPGPSNPVSPAGQSVPATTLSTPPPPPPGSPPPPPPQ